MLKIIALSALISIAGPAFGPSEEMFDRLESAPSAEEAGDIAADIAAAWMESGSPTVDLLMERATVARVHGDVKHAQALFDRSIRIQPDYAEAYYRRAGLFLESERYDEALRDLNATLAREPRHFGAWMTVAGVLEQLGSLREARDAYREVLEIYPLLDAARQADARLSETLDGTSL